MPPRPASRASSRSFSVSGARFSSSSPDWRCSTATVLTTAHFLTNKPRDEESVEPGKSRVLVREKIGQCADFAIGVDEFAETADFFFRDGQPDDIRIAAEQRRDLLFAFFGLERTGAVNDRSSRPNQFEGLVEHARLHRCKLDEIAGLFRPGDI